LQTKEELLDRICFILGGRCAEMHFFNEVTTGAYDDLEKAYNLAYHLVAKFGMNTTLGYIAFPDIQYTKPYGEKVEATIDR
jgi:AFG3 family protein